MTATMPQSGYGERKLEIGRVGQELFGLIQKDPIGTYGLAAALTAIPAILSMALLISGVTPAGTATGVAALARFSNLGPWFLVTGLVGLVVKVLMYGALGWGAVEGLEGRSPTIGQKLSAAGAVLLPMIGIAILGYIGIVIGMVFLVVPGVILALVWSMVLMAAVVDRAGVFTSFSRSAALTKNHRWTIFLLFLIYAVAAMVVGAVNLIFLRIGASGGVVLTAIITALLQIVISSLFNAVAAVGVGVVYQELRALKGEFDPGRLNRVFG